LELSTITAGQAKWTARWQTRIPGQRTIEAWTRLHMVLSGPAGRNSFGPPAARSKLDAGASPSALNSSRVRASRPPLESGGLMASRQHSSRRCRDRCRTCYPLIYQPRDHARLHGAGQGALPTIAVADLNLKIVPFSAQSPARPQTSWVRTRYLRGALQGGREPALLAQGSSTRLPSLEVG